MIESEDEAQYVWSHKAKIAIFLSAMRHFADDLVSQGYRLTYIKENQLPIVEVLSTYISEHSFTHLICVEPGEVRLRDALISLAESLDVNLELRPDTHFYCTTQEFKEWAGDKKELRLEYFYRYMRKKHQILMQESGEPEGGQWNFDDQNRKPYSKKGPGLISGPITFAPDEITQDVID